MKFAKEDVINKQGQVCVIGALALSQGISVRSLKQTDQGGGTLVTRLSKKLDILPRALESLIRLNDEGRWKRLEDRLRKLEIYHLVKKYALTSTKDKNRDTVTA